MRLNNISDTALLERTELLVRAERELLTQILHHLREIERRRLYSALKFSSLFAYAIGRLGYSEDQACRRIAAMKLLRDLPEIEAKLESGALTLTHVGMAQSLFRKKAFSKMAKLELLASLEHKPTREAEKQILANSPSVAAPRESVRRVTIRHVELRVVVMDETMAKIERLKGLFAHTDPGMTFGGLFDRLCEIALKSLKNQPAAPRADSKAEIRRQVWRRDRGRCTNCGSGYALEIDHVTPKAKGGADSLGNLRLLCRSCNQRAAIQKFGLGKMDPHLNSKPSPDSAARTDRRPS